MAEDSETAGITQKSKLDGSSSRERRSWGSRTDTLNKVFMPLATFTLSVTIFLGTSLANEADRQSSAKSVCRNATISLFKDAEDLINFAVTGGAPSTASGTLQLTSDDRIVAKAESLDVEGKFLSQECAAAKMTIPAEVNQSLCRLSTFVRDTDVAGDLRTTAVEIAKSNGSVRFLKEGESSKPTGCRNSIVTPAVSELTLFIQYPDTANRRALDYLITKINEGGLAHHKVVVPGAEPVEPPSKSTLRCLKGADCSAAKAIAIQLSAMLHNANIALLDLSKRYESRTDVRPGTLELWLSPADMAKLPQAD